MTNKKNKNMVVYGIFENQHDLESCIETLRNRGFRLADISVLFSSPETSKQFAHTNETKAPEGAVYGGSSGVAIGGTLGLLSGIGMLAIPGVGPFIAAGPIMSTLAGMGAGGVTGGVIGALVGMCFPEYEAKRYDGRIREGGTLLSVHADNSEWKKRAVKILEDAGAEDVSSSSESSAEYDDDSTPRAYNF